MKYKVGDIVFLLYMGTKRLYSIQNTTPKYVGTKILWKDGKIFAPLTSSWFINSSKYSDSRLATAQEIEDLVFPEGLDFYRANLNAGMTPVPALSSLFEALQALKEQKDEIIGVPRVTNPELLRTKPTCKRCEPMRYESFNMIYTICKNCDKTLAS